MADKEAALSLVRACRYQGECTTDFTEWSGYRNDITEYLCEHIATGSHVAVYGAGYCNDIDLVMLSAKAGHVTLIDVNGDAMKVACAKYGLHSDLVSTVVSDLMPIPDSVYEEYAQRCLSIYRHRDASEEDVLIRALEATYDKYFGDRCCKKSTSSAHYDYAVVFGLHSQLNNICSAILAAIDPDRKGFSQQFTKQIEGLQRRYYPQIVRSVSERIMAETTSAMFLGYEVEAWRSGRSLGAVEGAAYVPDTVADMCDEGKIKVSEVARVMWPFSSLREIDYEMEVLVCTK